MVIFHSYVKLPEGISWSSSQPRGHGVILMMSWAAKLRLSVLPLQYSNTIAAPVEGAKKNSQGRILVDLGLS